MEGTDRFYKGEARADRLEAMARIANDGHYEITKKLKVDLKNANLAYLMKIIEVGEA